MKNYYCIAKLIHGPNLENVWLDMGPDFETPADVIKFVGTPNIGNLERLEVTEFTPKGSVVEAISYVDFLEFYQTRPPKTEYLDIMGDLKKDWETAQALAEKMISVYMKNCYPIGWHGGLVIAFCEMEVLAITIRKHETEIAEVLRGVNPAIKELMVISPDVKPAIVEI